jgi:hypothetical protein
MCRSSVGAICTTNDVLYCNKRAPLKIFACGTERACSTAAAFRRFVARFPLKPLPASSARLRRSPASCARAAERSISAARAVRQKSSEREGFRWCSSRHRSDPLGPERGRRRSPRRSNQIRPVQTMALRPGTARPRATGTEDSPGLSQSSVGGKICGARGEGPNARCRRMPCGAGRIGAADAWPERVRAGRNRKGRLAPAFSRRLAPLSPW